MNQNTRQLIWSFACLIAFGGAAWFAYTKLGFVARRSVLVVSGVGAILSMLSIVASVIRVSATKRMALVADASGSGLRSLGIDRFAPALWMAGFFVSTPVLGLFLTIALFSLPALVFWGRLGLGISFILVSSLCVILFLMNRYLSLNIPYSAIF